MAQQGADSTVSGISIRRRASVPRTQEVQVTLVVVMQTPVHGRQSGRGGGGRGRGGYVGGGSVRRRRGGGEEVEGGGGAAGAVRTAKANGTTPTQRTEPISNNKESLRESAPWS